MKRNLVGKILGKIKIFVQDFVPIRTALTNAFYFSEKSVRFLGNFLDLTRTKTLGILRVPYTRYTVWISDFYLYLHVSEGVPIRKKR